MEDTWQCKVHNEYGCSELGILASECEHGRFHMSPETNYLEFTPIFSIENTSPLHRIVATNLDNRVMPLIRYDLGDGAEPSDETCPCGRTLPILRLNNGRLSAMMTTPNGKILSGLVFYYLFRDLLEKSNAPPQFQIHQKSIHHIHIIMTDDGLDRPKIESELKSKGSEFLGPGIQFTFEFVGAIPRPASGKLFHFRSDVPLPLTGHPPTVQNLNKNITG